MFDLNFSQISWLVPVLVFLATLLVSLSRERGGAITATLAGVFLILVIYLAIEPIGHAMLATEGSDLMISLMQTVRLGILGVLVHYSARHFLDAMLVTWVRSVLAGFDVVLAPQDED